ncbi:MAG: hypothetical protein QOF60_1495 [Actinomycetota bacterium]|jgi:hypothetical protein|nr:hypothetical protein [Actinomycetota bacterium]
MTDLEQAVRESLLAVPAAPVDLDDRVVEFRGRVKRRKARRRAGVAVAFVALAAVVGSTTNVGRPAHVRDAVVASVGESPVLATPAPAPEVFDPGPALRPEDVAVFAEGVAVEVDGVGVVLVGLDGRVFGHLPGFSFGFSEEAGPLQLRTRDDQYFVLDAGKLRPAPAVDGWAAWPLAYGAEGVMSIIGDPSETVVRRNGRQLFDLGNQMASEGRVSNDRDVVSITHFDTERSEALDLRSGKRSRLPYGCLVGDRHGSRRYLLCGDGTGETASLRAGKDTDPSPAVLFGPLDDGEGGGWAEAMVSPDGTQLLLGWYSNSCHEMHTYLAPSAGAELTPVERALGRDLRDTAIRPLGWTLDGRAIIEVLAGDTCGAPAVEPGVYAISGDDSAQVVAIPKGDPFRNAKLWAPALR